RIATLVGDLADPRRPRRERKADLQGNWELWLLQHHRSGLEDRRPLAGGRGEEAIFRALGLGTVQPPNHPDRRIRDDPTFHFAGGLLSADEDDAQAAATFGDVEQYLLDRAPPLTRRVLVELIED